MIFRSVRPTSTPIKSGETTFEFIERDGRQYSIRLRRWIEQWFDSLPNDSKAGFIRRLKSRDKENFTGAMFELQIHTLLKHLNCSVEIEPAFPNAEGRLDFRATHVNQSFYVEATVSGFGQGKLTISPNEEDAVKKLRKAIPSPHSNIVLHSEGELRTTLSARYLVAPFESLLARYTADDVKNLRFRGVHHDALSAEVRHGEWVLRGRLEPQYIPSHKCRIRGPNRAAFCDAWSPLSKSVVKKARKWKKADFSETPLFIAVNACHSEFDWYDYDIKRALFTTPEADSYFRHSLSHVSGVLVCERVFLGRETGARVKLYRNGASDIPECLNFLLKEQRLGDLLGIAD